MVEDGFWNLGFRAVQRQTLLFNESTSLLVYQRTNHTHFPREMGCSREFFVFLPQ